MSAVSRVLRSNQVSYWTGQEGHAFEREFAEWCGTRYAVALANGTLALDAALRALRLGAGDEVVVTPRTFIASVSSVVATGATPVFADVDSDSGNLTADSIEAVLTSRTRAVVCVHLAGWPCDMVPIMALAESRGLRVVEDCAQAHGARCGSRNVGSIGHVNAWSFCQDKVITTGGEGGMITTSDQSLSCAAWSYKDHGKSWEAVYERSHPAGFRWVHESFGTNARMLEVQAVIGRLQLRRLEQWTDARTMNALRIAEACRRTSCVRVPLPSSDFTHAFYRLGAYVRPEALASGWDRDRIIAELVARGVPCSYGSCPEVYLERAFDGTGWRPKRRLPVARRLGETSITFLVHPTLTTLEIDEICGSVSDVLRAASA